MKDSCAEVTILPSPVNGVCPETGTTRFGRQALRLDLFLFLVLILSFRQAPDGRNKRNFLEMNCLCESMLAPSFENEHASSTLRPHFKASEFFSMGSSFEEEINATHARTFLQHGGCSPFALKCARCVGSQPAAKLWWKSH